jgi:hypothetical protein
LESSMAINNNSSRDGCSSSSSSTTTTTGGGGATNTSDTASANADSVSSSSSSGPSGSRQCFPAAPWQQLLCAAAALASKMLHVEAGSVSHARTDPVQPYLPAIPSEWLSGNLFRVHASSNKALDLLQQHAAQLGLPVWEAPIAGAAPVSGGPGSLLWQVQLTCTLLQRWCDWISTHSGSEGAQAGSGGLLSGPVGAAAGCAGSVAANAGQAAAQVVSQQQQQQQQQQQSARHSQGAVRPAAACAVRAAQASRAASTEPQMRFEQRRSCSNCRSVQCVPLSVDHGNWPLRS